MHEVLVNRLGGLSLPRKSVVRLTDRPDMTLDVYRGRKTTMQQQCNNKSINKGCVGCSDYFLFTHAFFKRRQRFTKFMYHIVTAMMRRLTRVLFGHTFRKSTFQVNKINHKNVVKRGMHRMHRLVLVFAIRTCYKCHFSYTCAAQLDPDHTACVSKLTL